MVNVLNNDFRVHPEARVVGLDIDGTLADYYTHFKWFAELYTQTKIPTPDWSMTDEFSEALRLEKDVYRQIKLAYRQGGMKRAIPPLDAAIGSLVLQLRMDGYQVWICTTRPWSRLDNIDPDTRFWIERHLGRVDGVIYGEEKYEDLLDIVGANRIVGVVDDLPENVSRANALGIRTMIRAGDHNQSWRVGPNRNVDGDKIPVAHHSIDIYNQVKEWEFRP